MERSPAIREQVGQRIELTVARVGGEDAALWEKGGGKMLCAVWGGEAGHPPKSEGRVAYHRPRVGPFRLLSGEVVHVWGWKTHWTLEQTLKPPAPLLI